jgi:hypothetical protein
MANRNRRLMLAVVAMPFLLIALPVSARANLITVNTLDGGSYPAPLCTLEDAVSAANIQTAVNGCTAGSGDDTIVFAVTGTISISAGLFPTGTLSIIGPSLSPGITISGISSPDRLIDFSHTSLTLKNLTLADGSDSGFGGAIYSQVGDLDIEGCTFAGNTSGGSGFAGSGGAIFMVEGTTTIINSTFANNAALSVPSPFDPGTGGAINNDNGTLTATNVTFFNNQAALGASIFNSGSASTNLRATIFGPAAGLNLDPMGLRNNGGPTMTVALEPGSSAIGSDVPCVDQSSPPNAVVTDQRGFIRPDSPTQCDSGAYEHDGVQAAIEEVPDTERLQIARSTAPDSDQVNLSLGFIETAPCAGENALNDGILIQLFAGTCAGQTGGPLFVNLSPLVLHAIGVQTYGTFFQSISPETIAARVVTLPTPPSTCGEWTLNLDVSGVDTTALGLTSGNPFALVLTDGSGSHTGCVDIDNAVVGNQIPTTTRAVRRGVRR